VGNGRGDAGRLLNGGRAGHDAFDGGAEVDPPPLMTKAAAQTR
jgi:hypothetical protein